MRALAPVLSLLLSVAVALHAQPCKAQSAPAPLPEASAAQEPLTPEPLAPEPVQVAPTPLPEAPAPAPRAAEPPAGDPAEVEAGWRAPRRGLMVGSGAGLSFLRIASDDDLSVGLLVEGTAGYRFSELLSANLRFGWGLSHFERTGRVWEAATNTGGWTAHAYGDVTEWWLGLPREWALFGFIASVMAYAVLLVGFAAAGVMYALGPLAATSFLEVGSTLGVHFGERDLELVGEVGVGSMLFVGGDAGAQGGAGWGPLVGMRLRMGRYGVGVHALMAPPSLNGTRTAPVVAGGLTFQAHLR